MYLKGCYSYSVLVLGHPYIYLLNINIGVKCYLMYPLVHHRPLNFKVFINLRAFLLSTKDTKKTSLIKSFCLTIDNILFIFF